MIKSIRYVVSENISNIYRIFLIAKYEILAENRDSKLGILWNVLNPLIQISTYWFVFGIGIRSGKPVDGIEFLDWLLAGMAVWFFISPSIRKGVTSISSKIKVIRKMKFPVSILPTTVVVEETIIHLCMLVIIYVIFLVRGMVPSLYNFQVLYYLICGMAFSVSLAMITSVLNMFTRDVKKIVNATMRMLMYITPILWTMDKMPKNIQKIMKCNPIYYIVQGYRDSFFYHEGILSNINEMIVFWVIITTMFIAGSTLMYKFRHRFVDMM
ncbi:MAG: ABC transporter permease [Clostridium sulfidigenes]|uniref:Transport permease protein n=1 Tax=Clostridium sulfidigenes TaxID=318464 RepID=A0A927ZPV5_9CLOT|nr:ABC transporter permease [Clostridium sulfidigenes]